MNSSNNNINNNKNLYFCQKWWREMGKKLKL